MEELSSAPLKPHAQAHLLSHTDKCKEPELNEQETAAATNAEESAPRPKWNNRSRECELQQYNVLYCTEYINYEELEESVTQNEKYSSSLPSWTAEDGKIEFNLSNIWPRMFQPSFDIDWPETLPSAG